MGEQCILTPGLPLACIFDAKKDKCVPIKNPHVGGSSCAVRSSVMFGRDCVSCELGKSIETLLTSSHVRTTDYPVSNTPLIETLCCESLANAARQYYMAQQNLRRQCERF